MYLRLKELSGLVDTLKLLILGKLVESLSDIAKYLSASSDHARYHLNGQIIQKVPYKC